MRSEWQACKACASIMAASYGALAGPIKDLNQGLDPRSKAIHGIS